MFSRFKWFILIRLIIKTNNWAKWNVNLDAISTKWNGINYLRPWVLKLRIKRDAKCNKCVYI